MQPGMHLTQRELMSTPGETVNDTELVKQCQEELPYVTRAYEKLISRYDAMVYSFCLRYLGNAEDAEEVSQDVFLRVFHYVKKFEARSSFKTWLFSICRSQCASRYMLVKKKLQAAEEYSTEVVAEMSIDRNMAQDEHLDTAEMVNDILAQLSSEDREIIMLRHIAGFQFNEIAEMTGISLSAAKMRYSRSAERFRTKVEKSDF